MRKMKYLLASVCICAYSNSWASVTFFNNSNNATITVTYKLCMMQGNCSSTSTTKDIPPSTAYKDTDIQLSGDPANTNTYFLLDVMSLKITHADKSVTTKNFPIGSHSKNGEAETSCYIGANDTGLVFDTFANSPSEASCVMSTG